MSHRSFTRCVPLWAMLAVIPAPAIYAESDASTWDKAAELVTGEMTKQGIPGLSVAVASDNRLIGERGFGHADMENLVPARANTLYRTASIAKPMTATVILRLVDDGLIKLDEPVQTYTPTFPEKKWPITTRLVLAHQSGIRHYKSAGETTQTSHYISLKAAMAVFANDPLLHEPGTKFTYTTFGYNLLGCIAEDVSEKTFPQLLAESVFEPAGMKNTQVDDHFAVIPNRSRGYVRFSAKMLGRLPIGRSFVPGKLYNATLHDTSVKIPGGGLLSTAGDLVRFAVAMNQDKLISRETRDVAWTMQTTADGTKTRFGLGWQAGEWENRQVVAHGGGQAGTSTYLFLLPESGTAVAIMCNLQGAKLRPLAQDVAKLILGPSEE